MASADTMIITVIGKGGHASEPHRTIDPIPVACEIVQALQLMITRSIDVFDPSVVTVGRITAGTTNNMIPETAEIEGTIRAVSERTRAKVHDGIRRVADGIAAAHGCASEVHIDVGYPVTSNDDRFAAFASSMATDVIGADRVVQLPHPVMGAEDFSYLLQHVPGAMMFLGGTPAGRDPTTAAPNHSNRVFFDEPAMTHRHLPVRHRGAATPPPELTFASGFRSDGARNFDATGNEGIGVIGDGRPRRQSSTRPSKVSPSRRRSVTSWNGRTVMATMPSPTSSALVGSSSRLQLPRRDDPPIGPHVERRPVADRLVEADDEIARAVVGQLDRVDLHPRRGP